MGVLIYLNILRSKYLSVGNLRKNLIITFARTYNGHMIMTQAFGRQTNCSLELCVALNLDGWGLSSVVGPYLLQDGAIDTAYVLIPAPSFPQSAVCSLLPLTPQGAAQGSFAAFSL